MGVHQFPNNLPIIGERSWKTLNVQIAQVDPSDVWMETGKLVAQAWPRGLFIVNVTGVRSDDLPCQIMGQVPGPQFGDPGKVGVFINHLVQALMTYRDCACLPSQPCSKHDGSQQPKGTPNDQVVEGTEGGSPGPAVRH